MPKSTRKNTYAHIGCLLFDLDDTLYPHDSGIWEMVRKRIDQFLLEEMQFPAEEVNTVRSRFFHQYGTTLRGLQIEHEVDMDHYLCYVHDIPLDAVLSADPELDQMLHALPQRKVIFTNAYVGHARRVLSTLCIQSHFDTIIDIYTLYPHCKPQVEAFHKALAAIQEVPRDCLLIDDKPDNLATAQSLGMATVSIGIHHHDGSPHIADIKALASLLA
jgi:putative hydrolase of the HAD superfamily